MLEIAKPRAQKIVQFPHIHAYANNRYLKHLRKKHIPSGRVTFEDVVSFLFNDLGITPNRDDWNSVLIETRRLFDADKTR